MRKFHASKSRHSQFMFEYVGSGIGHNRYASGLYLGGAQTVNHYLDIMAKDEDADKRYFYKGREVKPDSPMFEAIEMLARGEKRPLSSHFMDLEKNLTEEKGVSYQIQIPPSVVENILDWNGVTEVEDINTAYLDLAKEILPKSRLPECLASLSGLIEKELPSTLSISNVISESAKFLHDYAVSKYGDSATPSCVEIEEYLYAHLRDDTDYLEEMHDEVGDYLHLDVMEALHGLNIPGFKVSDLSTHGQLYESIAGSFELGLHISESEAKREASRFISESLSVDGYTAPDIYNANDEEVILISERAFDAIKMTECDLKKVLQQEIALNESLNLT